MTRVWSLGITACALITGCATVPVGPVALDSPPVVRPLPQLAGSYHVVQRGETLWRIAHSYGLEPQQLAAANRLRSTVPVRSGQRLFVPLPPETLAFLWPVRGTVRSAGSTHGVKISASPGSLVRASRSGQVAVAAQQLAGWGRTVVLDHLDGHLTVYAGLDQILVSPGVTLRQGTPLGTIGLQAMHFEIRYGATPKNTLAYLPSE